MTTNHAASVLPDGPRLSEAETTFRWLAHPYDLLDECADTYGDIFTLRFARFGTHVVLSHPNDVRDVLAGDREALFAGRGNALLEPILGKYSLLLLDGDRHLSRRAMLQPAFRFDRVQSYAEIVAKAARKWTADWSSGTVKVQRTALDISKEVILRVTLGLRDEDQIGRLSQLIHELMLLVGTNATFDQSSDPRLMERFRRVRGALGDALQEHVERRQQEATPGDDVLSILVGPQSGSDERLSDEEIRDQLITMILAGHETTASSITWALVCLNAQASAMDRLVRELEEAKHLPDERLAGLAYLQAVCLETLRMRPVIPVVARELQFPFRIRDRVLPAGTFVTPCSYLAHRRPEAFPDPDTFKPERFLEHRYSPYEYFPFGGGVHRCIGMSFALLELQIVLGVLVRTFRFAACGPIRPVRRAVTIVASGGGKMHVERRVP